MALSNHELLFIVIPLLYLLTAALVFWQVFPRLPAQAKMLATVLLIAQLVVVLLSVSLDNSASYARRLFYVNDERNLAAGLATLQLALIAGYALLNARLGRKRPPWQRLYFVGLSLLFLYLASDELYVRHEGIPNWTYYYALVGMGVVLLTLIVARRTPKPQWLWYLCFLAGLAVSAAGAMLLEHLRSQEMCRIWRLFYIDRCLLKYIEESMEYLGIWLALIAVIGLLFDAAPLSKRNLRALLYAFPLLTLLLITRIGDPEPNVIEKKQGVAPAELLFETDVRIHGHRIEPGGEEDHLSLTFWIAAQPFSYEGLGYSIHLLDQADGSTLASSDKYVSITAGSVMGPGYLPIFRQTTRLSIPPAALANRAYWLLLTIWRESDGEFMRQRLTAADRRTLSETQVVLDELVLRAQPAALPATPRARFENGFALYDADAPASASPGDTLTLKMTWSAEADGAADYTQFLHFGHEESGELWAFDQQPLGARLPTRLWYGGLADSEAWQVALPADLQPGRYQVHTGLYHSGDLGRLPASDADGRPYDEGRVPLGVVTIG